MSTKAREHKACNLTQGFPDFDGPAVIKEAAAAAIAGSNNQYAPSAGLPELRRKVADRQKVKSGLNYDFGEEVTIFSGATEALFCAMQAFLRPGDECLAFAPFYDCYPGAAYSAGASLRQVTLNAPDFRFTEASLRAAVNHHTKMILVNSPHNPTGRVFDKHELELIADVAIAHDLLVVTDEVYEELTFDNHQHISLASFPGMRNRTIVISSTSKTYSMTGWKVGYGFAPRHITEALRKVHQFTVFCSATPLQVGMLAALELADTYYDDLRAYLDERRHLMVDALASTGWQCRMPEGTYFVLGDYSSLSDLDDYTFANRLINEHGIAAIPISGLYTDQKVAAAETKLLRFAFCKDRHVIDEAKKCLAGAQKILSPPAG